MNPETLKAIKEHAAAEVYGQFCGILNECQVPVIVDIIAAHFIAEVERQAREIERLRSKTVLCGNCGYRYQSPRDDDRHGLEVCG